MKALPLVSFLLAMVAWGLMAMMGVNLLSGELADRSCGTACVQSYFFAAIAVAVVALIVGALSLKSAGLNVFNGLALLAALGICGMAGFLFIAGTML